jgi:hypothetical protein
MSDFHQATEGIHSEVLGNTRLKKGQQKEFSPNLKKKTPKVKKLTQIN